MTIVDLDPNLEPLYLVCLEDWSPEMKETGDHRDLHSFPTRRSSDLSRHTRYRGSRFGSRSTIVMLPPG